MAIKIPEPKKIYTQDELDELRRQNVANAPDATDAMGQELEGAVVTATPAPKAQQPQTQAPQATASQPVAPQAVQPMVTPDSLGNVMPLVEEQLAAQKKNQTWQSALQGLLTPEQQKAITDSVFGTKPAVAQTEMTPAEKEEENVRTLYADLLKSKREALEKQRSSDARMARVNALGNVLTTMVQPLGWGIAGATPGAAGIEPYDNRQYLEAFNRAVKANDALRNIGSAEDEFNFNLAYDKYKQARAAEAYDSRKKLEAQLKDEYAQNQYEREMAKIDRRGEIQMDLAQFKAAYNVKQRNRVPVDEKMLSSAWTQYIKQRGEHSKDIGRGIDRKEGAEFPSFEEWLGKEKQWLVSRKGSGSSGNNNNNSNTQGKDLGLTGSGTDLGLS